MIETTPLSRVTVIYMCNTNLIYRAKAGDRNSKIIQIHHAYFKTGSSIQDIGWHSGSLSEDCYTKCNSSFICLNLRVRQKRSMGNAYDLQTERESLDDSLEAESGACPRSSVVAQQVAFSSSVDPPRPIQREIEDPGSTAEAPNVTISKPSDESKESVDQPNDQTSKSQLDTQAVQDALMTTPPTEGTPRLVRSNEVVLSDQYIEIDTEDKPAQLEETASVPPPFPSLTSTPPTGTPISRDTEHQEINEQNGEDNIEQPHLLTGKTDEAVGGRKERSTSEDSGSGNGKTGHSTRTKRKHKRKRQHGELRFIVASLFLFPVY